MKYTFLSDCVGSNNGPGIRDMVDAARDITRETFLQHVDREQLAKLELSLGYVKHHSQGLTMAQDWAVSYHSSQYQGKRCYYFRWSSIEHIFVPGGKGSISEAYGARDRTATSPLAWYKQG